jgi:hypothetical protein
MPAQHSAAPHTTSDIRILNRQLKLKMRAREKQRTILFQISHDYKLSHAEEFVVLKGQQHSFE